MMFGVHCRRLVASPSTLPSTRPKKKKSINQIEPNHIVIHIVVFVIKCSFISYMFRFVISAYLRGERKKKIFVFFFRVDPGSPQCDGLGRGKNRNQSCAFECGELKYRYATARWPPVPKIQSDAAELRDASTGPICIAANHIYLPKWSISMSSIVFNNKNRG